MLNRWANVWVCTSTFFINHHDLLGDTIRIHPTNGDPDQVYPDLWYVPVNSYILSDPLRLAYWIAAHYGYPFIASELEHNYTVYDPLDPTLDPSIQVNYGLQSTYDYITWNTNANLLRWNSLVLVICDEIPEAVTGGYTDFNALTPLQVEWGQHDLQDMYSSATNRFEIAAAGLENQINIHTQIEEMIWDYDSYTPDVRLTALWELWKEWSTEWSTAQTTQEVISIITQIGTRVRQDSMADTTLGVVPFTMDTSATSVFNASNTDPFVGESIFNMEAMTASAPNTLVGFNYYASTEGVDEYIRPSHVLSVPTYSFEIGLCYGMNLMQSSGNQTFADQFQVGFQLKRKAADLTIIFDKIWQDMNGSATINSGLYWRMANPPNHIDAICPKYEGFWNKLRTIQQKLTTYSPLGTPCTKMIKLLSHKTDGFNDLYYQEVAYNPFFGSYSRMPFSYLYGKEAIEYNELIDLSDLKWLRITTVPNSRRMYTKVFDEYKSNEKERMLRALTNSIDALVYVNIEHSDYEDDAVYFSGRIVATATEYQWYGTTFEAEELHQRVMTYYPLHPLPIKMDEFGAKIAVSLNQIINFSLGNRRLEGAVGLITANTGGQYLDDIPYPDMIREEDYDLNF
jgi:hypothetical protein